MLVVTQNIMFIKIHEYIICSSTETIVNEIGRLLFVVFRDVVASLLSLLSFSVDFKPMILSSGFSSILYSKGFYKSEVKGCRNYSHQCHDHM